MKQSGLYWHVHHEILFEYCYDAEERAKFIKISKPENEIATRLRLMKPIKGNLGDSKAWDAYVKAWDAFNKAGDAYVKAGDASGKAWDAFNKAWDASDKAWDAYNKAWDANDKARDAFNKAGAAYDKARTAFLDTIKPGEAEALHAIECPGCPWNGLSIFAEGEK